MTPEDYRERLSAVYGGRRWIVASDVLAGATSMVAALARLGAERCLCVATSIGTGALPDEELAPDPIIVEIEAGDMMTGIRRSLDALANLPPEALARVDAFDPSGRARVLGAPIFDDGRAVAGRTKYGARPRRWQLLEDKTIVDALWDEVGIARAPSRVVEAQAEPLWSASEEVNEGHGTVWSGDIREGFNGGATYVRWIRNEADAAEVTPFFEAHCHRVRVMPFLEGIPCSMHGFAFSSETVALRPCEMLVFRRPGANELHYGRAASFWDPPEADRRQMRDVARRLGDHLRQAYGYRGAFTIDGVMTERGFLPTELNPRFGAALGIMTARLDIPLMLLNAALIEGEEIDWQPAELERAVLEVADAHRCGAGGAWTAMPQTETRSARLLWDGARFSVSEDADAPCDAIGMVGPSPLGGFVKVDLVPERTPVGPSAAPRVAAALACLDAHWQLGIGPLEPATDVRR